MRSNEVRDTARTDQRATPLNVPADPDIRYGRAPLRENPAAVRRMAIRVLY
ncbi:MAG: hypothetical protein WD066_06585 [Planctomycetaceae bacterium]